MKKKSDNFSLRIGLASDSTIRSWSYGEVKKPETINYKTEKPVPDGLFCEKIFGPVKNNECSCGKYKRFQNRGKVCERCNVLVTDSIVRRHRMGHIELEGPVVHIWFHRAIPSKLAIFLDLPTTILDNIIYYDSYAVVDNGGFSDLKLGASIALRNSAIENVESESYVLTKKILEHLLKTEKDPEIYAEIQNFLITLESEDDSFFVQEFILFVNEKTNIQLETGALAVEKLLKAVNIENEINVLKEKLSKTFLSAANSNAGTRLLKRLEVLNSFLNSKQKPEWMVTRTIPVLPPELRPIVSLDGGKFAAAGINNLYAELLIRKGRLQKSNEKGAPIFMINELQRQIQEAVDLIFDNSLVSERRKKVTQSNLKSIATNLKGKTGRFRQNLLGKRVDYSAGSVIAGGPKLRLDECGLPRDIAFVLFRHFIISQLIQKDLAPNKKIAEKIIDEQQPIIWDLLEEIMKNYPVILNRAPTLHRLGIQAFYPKLIRGQAILLHPLVTTAYNADFDGDRMPIHLPLTEVAKQEARDLLLSTKNILNPRNGNLIVMPTQDIVLGLYYLTFESKGNKGEGIIFSDLNSVLLAYWSNKIQLHTLIFCPVSVLEKNTLKQHSDNLVITTVGKLIFNQVFGPEFNYISDISWTDEVVSFPVSADLKKVLADYQLKKPINKIVLSEIINHFLQQFGFERTVQLLDDLKDLGFQYSTCSGTTVSLFDLWSHHIEKKELFLETEQKVDKIRYFLQIGALTLEEKQGQKIKEWTVVKEKIESKLKNYFDDVSLDKPIRLMIDSGARGSIANFTQLVGIRGLMTNTKGRVIDTPIKSSLTEGLSVLEYYISTYGARKGMVDTALKTADSGYLTRRLVDATHDFYTVVDDCQTKRFLTVQAILGKMDSVVVPLLKRIYGRFSAENVFSPQKELLITANQLITKEVAHKIVKTGVKKVKIRSVLTCEAPRGVCCFCFGLDLAKNRLIEKGQAVGVLASQSIGEPATQLTMRTFHTGGVADVSDITQGLPRIIELFDVVTPRQREAILVPFAGTITAVDEVDNLDYEVEITSQDKLKRVLFKVKHGTNFFAKKHQVVAPGDILTEGTVNLVKMLATTKDFKKVANYIIEQVQKVYCLQGIEIADKYIEIIATKMLSRSKVVEPGDSQLMFGQELETYVLIEENMKLAANQQKKIQFVPVICGIKSVATKTNSFLSAASFQETTKVLINAAIENRVDSLYGLKENVIVGNIIPVGTGYGKKDEGSQS